MYSLLKANIGHKWAENDWRQGSVQPLCDANIERADGFGGILYLRDSCEREITRGLCWHAARVPSVLISVLFQIALMYFILLVCAYLSACSHILVRNTHVYCHTEVPLWLFANRWDEHIIWRLIFTCHNVKKQKIKHKLIHAMAACVVFLLAVEAGPAISVLHCLQASPSLPDIFQL